MEELIAVLKGIREDIDYKHCEDLIDGGHFDSFEIVQTITEIEEHFNLSIEPYDITPENFNSARALWEMIRMIRGRENE